MISWRGVAKKRRAQELAAMTVKSSLSVAARTQSWLGGTISRAGTATHNDFLRGQTLRFLARHNRQAIDRPDAGPPAPNDFRLADRERQVWPALERAAALDP
jgi:hypothetical protein